MDWTTSPQRKARDAEGLSRDAVARLLDPPVTAKTIERWEKGDRTPRWRLKQLAALYNVTLADLENDGVAA